METIIGTTQENIEGFFARELEAVTTHDAYVFPYVTNLLSRMVRPETNLIDDENPLSIHYLELKLNSQAVFGAGNIELGEWWRAMGDELFFSCSWTPERFERPRRQVDGRFYVDYGRSCYTQATRCNILSGKEDRATTLAMLVDEYEDWAKHVNTVRQHCDGRIPFQMQYPERMITLEERERIIMLLKDIINISDSPGAYTLLQKHKELLD